MKIVFAGGNGFLGKALIARFRSRGHVIVLLNRKMYRLDPVLLAVRLEGADVIVNLAGAPILSRWTPERMKLLTESRVMVTRNIAEALGKMMVPPSVFISGSAIGIYKQEGVHTEDSPELATDFLGGLCREWESAAGPAASVTRVVFLRTGVILGKGGGALSGMLPLFRAGLGGIIGTGRQGFSWMHLSDFVDAVQFILDHPGISGPVNMVAPQPADNREFARTLAAVLHRPAFLHVPAFMLQLLYGKGASVITGGQKVIPSRLTAAGFSFTFPTLKECLADILS